eukprot:c8419_g1_i4.p2 GENE.c8419_g1_i4~~c8419_g1_i4.p2  ORF type:complete len:430 (-),score=109.13 c8419_g1_i4:137-1426(-)
MPELDTLPPASHIDTAGTRQLVPYFPNDIPHSNSSTLDSDLFDKPALESDHLITAIPVVTESDAIAFTHMAKPIHSPPLFESPVFTSTTESRSLPSTPMFDALSPSLRFQLSHFELTESLDQSTMTSSPGPSSLSSATSGTSRSSSLHLFTLPTDAIVDHSHQMVFDDSCDAFAVDFEPHLFSNFFLSDCFSPTDSLSSELWTESISSSLMCEAHPQHSHLVSLASHSPNICEWDSLLSEHCKLLSMEPLTPEVTVGDSQECSSTPVTSDQTSTAAHLLSSLAPSITLPTTCSLALRDNELAPPPLRQTFTTESFFNMFKNVDPSSLPPVPCTQPIQATVASVQTTNGQSPLLTPSQLLSSSHPVPSSHIPQLLSQNVQQNFAQSGPRLPCALPQPLASWFEKLGVQALPPMPPNLRTAEEIEKEALSC